MKRLMRIMLVLTTLFLTVALTTDTALAIRPGSRAGRNYSGKSVRSRSSVRITVGRGKHIRRHYYSRHYRPYRTYYRQYVPRRSYYYYGYRGY